jgi:DNA uptake protein ComE-like DNA-binding protein
VKAVLCVLAFAAAIPAAGPAAAAAVVADTTARAAGGAGASIPSPVIVDVNEATPAELVALGLPPAVAEAVVDHRTYVAYFNSLFDLLQVPGMTPELLALVRGRIEVAPVFETARREQQEEERRAGELTYLVQRLLAEEGANEGLVDAYVDRIKDPRNINHLGYFDLLFYQNVSPVDARAILEERRQAGRIESARQLRAAPGLSYWGFRNLRDFVRYDDPARQRLRLDYQFRLYDTPYVLDDADILEENILGDTQGLSDADAMNFRSYERNTYAGRLALNTTDPAMTQKLRLAYGQHWRAGAIAHRNLAEHDWAETVKGAVALEDLPARDTPLGRFQLHAAVLGHFTAAFGQGLVLENTDFFMPRRTGLGFGVRSIGVHPDLSRSEEFALRGAALEASLGAVRGTFLVSRDRKDAILNPDGSFHSYIRMVPRLTDDLLAGIRDDIGAGVFAGRGDPEAFLPMRDVMDETVTAANVRILLAPTVYVGATGLDIRTRNRAFDGPLADRWDPDPSRIVLDPGRIEDRDAEIGAAYNSLALGNYRRVWGGEAASVWNNVAFATEYAKLETSPARGAWERILSAGPEAFLAHGYLQLENLNALALYRDYDLGYDNPYARAFSEDSRYEQTILDGNAFRLRNPYWAQLSRYLPQPKAERGWYFNARYQFSRPLLLSGLEYDTWTRVADGADLRRFAVRLEYRPIFPLRIRVRHSDSGRHDDRPDDIRAFHAWDTRVELIANLSSYDQVRLLYSTGNVTFPARGRLSGPAAGGDVAGDTTAVRGEPGRSLQAALTHNVSDDMSFTLSTQVYDGFTWNYEDNEFSVMDGKGFRNWFLMRSRLSDRLSWRLKWTYDHQLARTHVDIRDFGALVAPTPDATNARDDRSWFRLQLDYSL